MRKSGAPTRRPGAEGAELESLDPAAAAAAAAKARHRRQLRDLAPGTTSYVPGARSAVIRSQSVESSRRTMRRGGVYTTPTSTGTSGWTASSSTTRPPPRAEARTSGKYIFIIVTFLALIKKLFVFQFNILVESKCSTQKISDS